MSINEWNWRMDYCISRRLSAADFWDIAGVKYKEFIDRKRIKEQSK